MASAPVSELGKAVNMATYGAYPRDEYGHVIAPPRTFEATKLPLRKPCNGPMATALRFGTKGSAWVQFNAEA